MHHVDVSHIPLLLQNWPVPHALPHVPQLVAVLSGVHVLRQHPWPAWQQAPAQAACPCGQTRQSVPAELQAPLAQLVTVGVEHWPLELHVAADVVRPAVQDCSGPHDVPAALLVVAAHTEVPVAQEVAPFLHGSDG